MTVHVKIKTAIYDFWLGLMASQCPTYLQLFAVVSCIALDHMTFPLLIHLHFLLSGNVTQD